MKKNLLQDMLHIVVDLHYGQFDKGGLPYAFHCIAVMRILNSDDEQLNCIALGHDLLEDTSITYEELENHFGYRIAKAINNLTKRKNEPYEIYKMRVKSSEDSIRVKMADLRHNSDLTRLKGITEKDHARMAKYAEFYYELKEKLDEISGRD